MEQFTPFIRHILQIGTGALVAKGYIDENAAVQVVGIGMGLFALGWYQFSKSRKALKLAKK